jgi:hypothetical protein
MSQNLKRILEELLPALSINGQKLSIQKRVLRYNQLQTFQSHIPAKQYTDFKNTTVLSTQRVCLYCSIYFMLPKKIKKIKTVSFYFF